MPVSTVVVLISISTEMEHLHCSSSVPAGHMSFSHRHLVQSIIVPAPLGEGTVLGPSSGAPPLCESGGALPASASFPWPAALVSTSRNGDSGRPGLIPRNRGISHFTHDMICCRVFSVDTFKILRMFPFYFCFVVKF